MAKEAMKQEPAAILNHAHGVFAFRSVKLNGLPDGEYALYTPPPAQRQWVGLTDEEIMTIGRELGAKCRLGGNPNIDFDYARAIEAKLKEKNNG